MNRWAIAGIEETYKKTGVSFDKVYFESNTYMLGKDEIIKGVKAGVFFKKEDGSIWVDLSAQGLDRKVLLRGDGTSLYVTQDIGAAIMRHNDWPFDRLIYVVASEQKYHFKTLFKVLGLLAFPWAGKLFHLSYGMVNLPEGKMKSREGTVVDADDLLEELKSLAQSEIKEKDRENNVEHIKDTAEKIALSALNYYLLQTSPAKDMLFNPRESISFNGNTGPYLQYTGVRIASILRKYEERKSDVNDIKIKQGRFNPNLLIVKEEWEIIKLLAYFPDLVVQAGEELNPSLIAARLYELAKSFNKYYHDNPVLNNENPDLVVSRIRLVKAIRQILENGFYLLGIPFLECM